MEVLAVWIFVWFVCLPKSFGRHLGVIMRPMGCDAVVKCPHGVPGGGGEEIGDG